MSDRPDFLYRGLIDSVGIRFTYTVCTQTCTDAVLAHNCDPAAAHVLCRALGAGVLCAPLLGEGERFSLNWTYDGTVRSIVVVVDAAGCIRGLISPPQIAAQADTTADVFGTEGRVTVVRSDSRRTLNSGVAAAGLLDVVEDLAYFFCVSDQIETGMAVLVGFNASSDAPVALCHGVMVQALPGCDLEVFGKVRERLQSPELRSLLEKPPRNDRPAELVLQALIDPLEETGRGCTIVSAPRPRFYCPCTHEHMLEVLKTLGEEDLAATVQRGESLRVICHFCSTPHTFSVREIASLIT